MAEGQNSYYQRNKEKICARKKLKYKTDPEFREAVKACTKSCVDRKAEEKRALKKVYSQEGRVWVEFRINGKVEKMCKIGFLAMKLARTPDRIKQWEKEGKMPKTFRYKNFRYYSEEQIKLILKIWRKYSHNQKQLSGFFSELRVEWNKLLEKKAKENGKKSAENDGK